MTDGHFAQVGVPDGMGEFCVEMAKEIANRLGESPEAWRGAAELAIFVKSGCINEIVGEIEAHGGNKGELELSETTMCLAVVIGMLERFPTWPQGYADESTVVATDD